MKFLVCLLAAMLNAPVLWAQHSHFVAGAELPLAGAKLIAVNSNDFVHTSRYVRTLNLSAFGSYAGYYNASCPFVVAAATPEFGGPEANAPAPGSFIEMELISLKGPPGGRLGYWEALRTGSPTFSVVAGTTNGTNRIVLSDPTLGAGQPGADPFGHVHGRRLSADIAGFYVLGYRFIDTSTNGPGGSPIHAPSETYYLYLQGGYTLSSVNLTEPGVEITFGTVLGQWFFVEFREDLGALTDWTDLHGPVEGNDRLQTFRHENKAGPSGFYRIKAIPQ